MPLTAAQLPNVSLPWPIQMVGVGLIAEAEQGPRGGVALVAYRCIAGVWTCGWGETAGVGPATKWTKDYADRRFCDSLTLFTDAVRAVVTVPTTDSQLAALVSLAYNIGLDAFRRSTVLRCHNGGDTAGAARAFGLWNKARVNGQLVVLPGLVTRRAREAALYLTPDPDAAPDPMPQAVAAESSLARSPIAAGGAVTSATGAATAIVQAAAPDQQPAPAIAGAASPPGAVEAVAQVGQQVGAVQASVQAIRGFVGDTLGIPPGAVLPVVLVLAGGLGIYWRHRQRREGWA